MRRTSLRALPKIRDSWSFLYVDRCNVERDRSGVVMSDERGRVPLPCAMLTLLMLGPGSTISHAAVRELAEAGCLIAWTGEDGVRFYALGLGETRSSKNILRQVRAFSDEAERMRVVRRMYSLRFPDPLPSSLTLKQIRGLEGVRVREAYSRESRATGVVWRGRSYRRSSWESADPVNRAISSANACLYGVCMAAIVSAGYSPAIGLMVLEAVPESVRGELSRWLIEVRAGVFVGSVSAAVREELWERVCATSRCGSVLVANPASNEQGFEIRSRRDRRRYPEDFDGLLLMRFT